MFPADLLSQPSVPKNLPNIIFILADDVGYGDLGSYGGKLPTPNLDKLARQGMRFTDAHAPAALCAPSRYSLLTGNYPYRSYRPGGAWNTSSPSIFSDPKGIKKAKHHVTVAEILKKTGYRTAFIGKSHLGGDILNQEGKLIREESQIYSMDISKGVHNSINEYGFDYSYSLPSGIQHEPFAFFENGFYAPFDPAKPADSRSTKMWQNGRYAGENGMSEIVEHAQKPGLGDVDYNSSQVGIMMLNKSLRFIDNHQMQNKIEKEERPFFLYFASQAIHVPHTPPLDYDGAPQEINEKVSGITKGATGDCLYELDMQVGKLLEKLEEEGLQENTLIFFTSDNGALWPDICDFGNLEHDNNGPLRDYKASVYEGGHRVPFIVWWPAKVRANSISDEPIVIHDWVATMYELTGQDMEEDQAMDCISLMSLITGKKSSTPLHPFLMYQAGFSSDGAIREGDWVLLVDRNNEATELYNLKEDLAQKMNIIDLPEHRTLINRLRAKFLKYNDHNKDTEEPRTTQAYRSQGK